MKKKWTKPQLVVIKSDKQESVLKCCKSSSFHGPHASGCVKLICPCKDLAGS